MSPAPEAEFLETLFGGWKAEGRSLLSPCFVCLVSSASPAREGGGILCSLAPGPALLDLSEPRRVATAGIRSLSLQGWDADTEGLKRSAAGAGSELRRVGTVPADGARAQLRPGWRLGGQRRRGLVVRGGCGGPDPCVPPAASSAWAETACSARSCTAWWAGRRGTPAWTRTSRGRRSCPARCGLASSLRVRGPGGAALGFSWRLIPLFQVRSSLHAPDAGPPLRAGRGPAVPPDACFLPGAGGAVLALQALAVWQWGGWGRPRAQCRTGGAWGAGGVWKK